MSSPPTLQLTSGTIRPTSPAARLRLHPATIFPTNVSDISAAGTPVTAQPLLILGSARSPPGITFRISRAPTPDAWHTETWNIGGLADGTTHYAIDQIDNVTAAGATSRSTTSTSPA